MKKSACDHFWMVEGIKHFDGKPYGVEKCCKCETYRRRPIGGGDWEEAFDRSSGPSLVSSSRRVQRTKTRQ